MSVFFVNIGTIWRAKIKMFREANLYHPKKWLSVYFWKAGGPKTNQGV